MKTIHLAILCTITASIVHAETTFKNSLNLGYTRTDGNSETQLGNLSILSEGKLPCGSNIRLGAEGNYGESQVSDTKETTVENANAFANAKRDLSERWFVAMNAAVSYDSIADIDYRALLGPAIGGYLIRNEKIALTTEIGPSYLWEKVADQTDDYLVLRLSERLEYNISETAQIWQTAEYLPKAEELDEFLLNAELGASSTLSARMQLRIVLQAKHDSTPANPELEKTDLTFITGIGITL